TDLLMSKAAKLAAYQRQAGETDPIEMLSRLELSIEEMGEVVERAHDRGLHAIVTVFSVELIAQAESLAWDAYKSASPDLINRPLLEAMAATGKPLIVSTGASTIDEVVRAVGWLEESRDRLALLQCVSSYPAPEPALDGIGALGRATGLPVGYSDHTRAIETGRDAAALGAIILERHLTYDTCAPGPDHAASFEPAQFARYVTLAHAAQPSCSRSPGGKAVLDCERDVRRVSRQSLTARVTLPAGHTLARTDLTIKRPGTGIEPWRLEETIGCTLARDVEADVSLVEADLTTG
ncbi:N-acetylneuraminate synthase, partial [hydrothermal vent metagenome]